MHALDERILLLNQLESWSLEHICSAASQSHLRNKSHLPWDGSLPAPRHDPPLHISPSLGFKEKLGWSPVVRQNLIIIITCSFPTTGYNCRGSSFKWLFLSMYVNRHHSAPIPSLSLPGRQGSCISQGRAPDALRPSHKTDVSTPLASPPRPGTSGPESQAGSRQSGPDRWGQGVHRVVMWISSPRGGRCDTQVFPTGSALLISK